MQGTAEHLIVIPARGLGAKIPLATIGVAAVLFAYYSVSWQIGSMLSELTPSTGEDSKRVAEAAISLAPRDPRSRWLLGAALRDDFSAGGMNASSESLKEAVRLAPYNYRMWAELGRSYEQADRLDMAEAAFRKAVSLAPEYTLPNWQLGNFYLRQGRIDEAIPPLQVSAKYSDLYRGQVFAIAWSFFGGDERMVDRFAADDPDSVASLASFYAGVGRPDEALRTWNRLSDHEKSDRQITAGALARSLFGQRRYLVASELAKQSGLDKAARVGAFTNGDFENGVREPNTTLFDWTAERTDGKVDIGTDSSVAHGGKRSLRALFRGYTKIQFFDIRQLIAVRPGSRQRIEFWVRTENLRGGSMPLFSVLSGADERTLAVSPPIPSGTNDWQKLSVELDVPANAEGIRLVSGREPCTTECPLTGIFWIDDFQLTEVGR